METKHKQSVQRKIFHHFKYQHLFLVLDLKQKKFLPLQHPEFENTDMQPCFCAGGFCFSDNGEDSGKLSFLHGCMCECVYQSLSIRWEARCALCFIALRPATEPDLIAVAAVGGAAAVACHPDPVSWELGVRQGPDLVPWDAPNCHLLLLMLHTWGSELQLRPLRSHTLRTPPLRLPSFSSHPAALLTLYSSQRLSICIFWSMGLTRSISTLALASLITASLHGWVFKDNWACEPASLWVTEGWNDNQLDPIQVQSQQGLLDCRQPAGFPVFKKIF